MGVKAQSDKKSTCFFSEQQAAGYLSRVWIFNFYFIPCHYLSLCQVSLKTIFTLYFYFHSPNTEERTRGCLKTILSLKICSAESKIVLEDQK